MLRCRDCTAGRRSGPAAVTGRRPRPARTIKAAGRHVAGQPGSVGLKARERHRAAIYDAARQDDAGLSYNQC